MLNDSKRFQTKSIVPSENNFKTNGCDSRDCCITFVVDRHLWISDFIVSI